MALSNLASIGGGNGAIAIIQERWLPAGILEPSLFAWAVALGQITPGPRIAFVAAVGYYLAGLTGAIAALVGIVIPTTISAAGMSFGIARVEPMIRRISLPAAYIISGMIAAAAWGIASPLGFQTYEAAAVLIVAVLIAWKNIDPVWIICGAAILGVLLKLISFA